MFGTHMYGAFPSAHSGSSESIALRGLGVIRLLCAAASGRRAAAMASFMAADSTDSSGKPTLSDRLRPALSSPPLLSSGSTSGSAGVSTAVPTCSRAAGVADASSPTGSPQNRERMGMWADPSMREAAAAQRHSGRAQQTHQRPFSRRYEATMANTEDS